MKVVHLVTYDKGGAYNAAKRISDSLINIVENQIIVFYSKNEHSICNSFFKLVWHKIQRILNYYLLLYFKKNDDYSHEFFSSNISSNALIKDADVIHIHWISSGMLSIRDLANLVKLNKKIIWTLHDMYPMTGGCHYTSGCKGYIDNKCERCPRLKHNSKLATKHLEKMKNVLENANITIVGCSNWISECAKKSYIFNNKKIFTIPNTINFSHFYHMSNNNDEKIVVYGAYLVNEDYRKGYDIFVNIARETYKRDKDIFFYVFGNTDSIIAMPNVKYLGLISDENEMRVLYSKAKVSLSLSREENLSCTIMESLACGTPVIAFDIGGNKDLISCEIMGKLVPPFQIGSMVDSIIEYINKNINRSIIIKNTKEKFDPKIISMEYYRLYK